MLSEPWQFHFPYTRTTGPVVGKFLTGLQQQKIFGLRMADGGVLVPPHAHDPQTSATLDEWVEVGQQGVVTHWTWIAEPHPNHPLEHPFAYGLVTLDGAATGFFHAIDAGTPEAMATGMRVKVRWADKLRGHVTDIACFVPLDAPEPDEAPEVVLPEEPRTPEKWRFDAPFRTEYEILAGHALSYHLQGLKEKKLIGVRGPSGNVYLPPNGADAVTGGSVGDDVVELPQTGTVVRYCVVNIPVRGQAVNVPFACADVLVDGADNTFMTLIQGIEFNQVRLGLRVRAVWVDDDQLDTNMASIKWFEPSGEADADLSEIEAYL